MGVLCFSSLKGGVGKTSLSVNIAHALAVRDCKVLLIDTDPLAHASRLLLKNSPKDSPLAQLMLPEEQMLSESCHNEHSLVEHGMRQGVKLIQNSRTNLDVISSSASLRHFYWGKGARLFSRLFPVLIQELIEEYDYIIIDTAPDFNVVTRSCIAQSSMVVMPTDPSEMGVYALEELVASASHIKGPLWTIARTLVNKQATRVSALAKDRIVSGLNTSENREEETLTHENFNYYPESDDPEVLVNLLDSHSSEEEDDSIYLLNSLIYRTEEQNRLSLQKQTAFDSPKTSKLAVQYLNLAIEMDKILAWSKKEQLSDTSKEEYSSFDSQASFA